MWFFDVESGRGSRREVEEFLIHPNLIKNLPVGRCVCIKKYPHARAYWLDVNALETIRKAKASNILNLAIRMAFRYTWISTKWVVMFHVRLFVWYIKVIFGLLKSL